MLSNIKVLIILLYSILHVNNALVNRIPVFEEYFCKNNNEIMSKFTPGVSTGYKVIIKKLLLDTTLVKVKLDSGGAISFDEPGSAIFTANNDLINNVYNFILLKDINNFTFTVIGRFSPNHPPYVINLKINGEENCKDPDRTYFARHLDVGIESFWPGAPDKFCGRRRINRKYTELILGGSASKSGDWPWHSAIYRLKRGALEYICGGTIVSTFSILTAAHCTTIRGVAVNPDMLGVILGKYKLIGSEVTTQDKDVHSVIVHDDFEHTTLNNDIAILKLTTEVVLNNYVQPACLWLDEAYDQIDSYEIIGTVVGWGIDQSERLSKNLREAPIPLVPEITCIRYDPIFYNNILNGKKFCAGSDNGTVACNGDSGGGFFVFVPDSRPHKAFYLKDEKPGAWYVKGIVSVSLARHGDSVCDPRAYTVFTDVAKYRDWILSNM